MAAVRLDLWKNIVNVGWGGACILTSDFNQVTNPSTSHVERSGYFDSFSAGGPGVDGGGTLNRSPVSGVNIELMYAQRDEDLEHGGDPVWRFHLFLASGATMPPGVLTIDGYGSFAVSTADGNGPGHCFWSAPNVPEFHISVGDHVVTFT